MSVPREAIRAIGTNALPMIECELRVRDSGIVLWSRDQMLKRGWVDWYLRLPESASWRHRAALDACAGLEDKALPMVPVIVELLSEDLPFESRRLAACHLKGIGREAATAIPELEAAVQNQTLIIEVSAGVTNDLAADALLAIRGRIADGTNVILSKAPTP